MKSTLQTPRPGPTQRRSREKYQRVLDAAEALISTEGYENITTTGVAQAAGLPSSAFYRWFADKDALARALLERHNARLDTAIASAVDAVDQLGWIELAEATYFTTVDYYRDNPSHRIIWYEGRVGPGARRETHEHTARLAQALLERAQAGGFAPPEITLDDVKLVIEIADRVVEVAFRDDSNGDDELLERGLMMVLMIVTTLRQPGDFVREVAHRRRRRTPGVTGPT